MILYHTDKSDIHKGMEDQAAQYAGVSYGIRLHGTQESPAQAPVLQRGLQARQPGQSLFSQNANRDRLGRTATACIRLSRHSKNPYFPEVLYAILIIRMHYENLVKEKRLHFRHIADL